MGGTALGKMKGNEKAIPGPRKCLEKGLKLGMTTAFGDTFGHIEYVVIWETDLQQTPQPSQMHLLATRT